MFYSWVTYSFSITFDYNEQFLKKIICEEVRTGGKQFKERLKGRERESEYHVKRANPKDREKEAICRKNVAKDKDETWLLTCIKFKQT